MCLFKFHYDGCVFLRNNKYKYSLFNNISLENLKRVNINLENLVIFQTDSSIAYFNAPEVNSNQFVKSAYTADKNMTNSK